jgi:hypothetical protein
MTMHSDTPLREEDEAGRARRRHRRVIGIAGGAAVGALVGILALVLTDSWHTTGNDSNPAVYVFGLPLFTAIVGAVMGWLFSGIPEANEVDAPVRDPRFAAAGRAATSVHGQEPGSPVHPTIPPDQGSGGRQE